MAASKKLARKLPRGQPQACVDFMVSNDECEATPCQGRQPPWRWPKASLYEGLPHIQNRPPRLTAGRPLSFRWPPETTGQVWLCAAIFVRILTGGNKARRKSEGSAPATRGGRAPLRESRLSRLSGFFTPSYETPSYERRMT